MRILCSVIFVSTCLVGHYEGASNYLKTAREGHRGTTVSDDQVKKIAGLENAADFKTLLDPIMIPRVVGTANHENVKKYLMDTMENLGWQVEEDAFSATTPMGRLKFGNVIARLNPQAERFLTLACHYDSKYTREGDFIGATDSAVPCAMLLHLASSMDLYLKKNSLEQSTVSLKFIFFDGEEAFKTWGPNDSIYGAKNLARKLQKSSFRAGNGEEANHLDRMDMLVLLDLIGVEFPSFYNYFADTDRWYKHLVGAEDKLAKQRLLEQYNYGFDGYPKHRYFNPQSIYAGIEDDHIPFLRRGVPILHLIPSPFPTVWHKSGDNYSALDFSTIANLNKIMRIFVAEYLSLSV
ncbi:glutaminyl-peptide cyclotransferase-like isoform X2 [Neocloeon triangulifer]|uniref:glutaminyl-peptide cyclotransferase-like isoform X2 n=1 Tax=Neocloeon triangulifer TaxID=2078957 RepID=UPI00286F79A2|nr:glutaminyl-peptide cyclotransferase-like isoform X2 [Neocloeon triangulifer]